MALIVIDPGHGGTDPGTHGPGGTQEKTLTLDIGRRVADILNPEHRAELTRRGDVFVELGERAEIARRLKADVFVSIHFNSPAPAQGTETYHHQDANDTQKGLANTIHPYIVGATGLRDRGVKQASLVVLDPARHYQDTVACLAEVSFLTDPKEEKRLGDETYRQEIAQAITNGIRAYLAK